MPRPSFNNVGLRRDLNLSDIESKELALNNLLNNLVTTQDGQVFSSGDLEAIEGIANSTVTNRDIGAMAGLTVKNTILNQETGELEDVIATPLITVKNQVDSIILTTNDPPFFNGGDGLTAQFWEAEEINPNLNINSTGANVVTGDAVVTKTFWDNGFFEFSNKLDNTLGGSNGAIQWTGWYIPDASGPSTFSITTSGLCILEFENENGILEVVKNIYTVDRPVFATAAVIDNDSIPISASEARTVAIGDEVVSILDNNGDPISIPDGLVVEGVGSESINLNQNVSIDDGYRINLSLANKLGTENFRISYVLANLEKYVPRAMRLTYWFPGVDTQYFYKILDVNLATSQKDSGNLPYWYLYTEIGEQETDDGFKGFFDKRLDTGGGIIGPEVVVNSTQYNKYQSISPLTVIYEPPYEQSQAIRAEYTYSILQNSNVLSVTGTSPYTDNIEIGNLVVGGGLPQGARVQDISRNNIVILNVSALNDATATFTFLDHRGLIHIDDVQTQGIDGNGDREITIADTSLLDEDMIAVVDPGIGNYTRIKEVRNNKQVTLTNTTSVNTPSKVYFYSDKGLRNESLDNFCIGSFGKELSATATAGSTILTLNNVDGIQIGQIVQSSPYISVNNATVVDVDTIQNQIEISTSGAFAEEAIAGTTLVFSPAGTTLNKEACVIPLNTAPPFVGTLTGLRTTDGSGTPAFKDFVLNNGDLKCRSLNALTSTTVELPSSGTFSYDRTINIKCNGSNFKILGTTSGS